MHHNVALFLRCHCGILRHWCSIHCLPYHSDVSFVLRIYSFYSTRASQRLPQRYLLYPCLSEIDDKTPSSPTTQPSSIVLEDDATRLVGACFLAISVSSVGLLVPLLPWCQYEKSKEDDTNYQVLSNYFFLRTLFFIQGEFLLLLTLCYMKIFLSMANNSTHFMFYVVATLLLRVYGFEPRGGRLCKS
jgi:hypothetical protein